MKKKIHIVGAGGHAKVVIEIAELLGHEIVGVYDQDDSIKKVLEYPVFHNLNYILKDEDVFFAIGNNSSRKQNSGNFPLQDLNLIHPSVIISKSTLLGYGNVIMAGAIVNSSTKIENHCIINTGACIDHDCEIGSYVHISPRVALAGNVKVMEGAHVGIGACVKQNIKIGKWSIVGAGAVVVSDVPDNVIVVGNPARIIKKIE